MNFEVKWLAPLLLIQEVPDSNLFTEPRDRVVGTPASYARSSNLCPETRCCNKVFIVFLSPRKYWDGTVYQSSATSSDAFPIYSSVIIL
jgi:hypothetical protein